MNTNTHELIYKDEAFQIVGCAMEVHNALGGGFLEKVYENALVIEFRNRGIPFYQQNAYAIHYKGEKIGNYIPDLVAHEKIVLDLKTIDKITDAQRAQMINYLRVTDLHLGLILNFRHAKLEWERIVL